MHIKGDAFMSDISFWAKAAKANLDECVVSSREIGDVTSVRFARFMALPEPGTVYIATGDEMHSILTGGKSCLGATFLFRVQIPVLRELPETPE